jgi:hypothetical protein
VVLVDSRLRAGARAFLANAPRDVRWFLANYLLLNAYVFVLYAAHGVVLFTSSSDATIAGWSGSAIEQVFWYSIGTVFYSAVFFGIPVLLVALLAWRLAIRLVGHPRLTACVVATLLVVAAALLIERTQAFYLVLVLVAALGYATIVGEPGSP